MQQAVLGQHEENFFHVQRIQAGERDEPHPGWQESTRVAGKGITQAGAQEELFKHLITGGMMQYLVISRGEFEDSCLFQYKL